MAKKGIIVSAAIALIVVLAVFGLNLLEDPPGIIEQPHMAYLRDFLAGTRLTLVPVVRNDFPYYELLTADEQLAGFVFPGTTEGWAGPIHLFVKTDAAGKIQRVHVWHHSETPNYVVGLDAFLATFAGYQANAELIWQEDVHGITGATVTPEAIIAAGYGPGRTAYQKGKFMQRER